MGPSLVGVGEAAVYFQVSTGRMPLARQEAQSHRKPPVFTPEEIDALAAYVQAHGGGETMPAQRGAELRGDVARYHRHRVPSCLCPFAKRTSSMAPSSASDRTVRAKARSRRSRWRRKVTRLLFLLLALGVTGAAYGLFVPKPPVVVAEHDPAVVRRGEELFDNSCLSCHGANLTGHLPRGSSWSSWSSGWMAAAPTSDGAAGRFSSFFGRCRASSRKRSTICG
jgi:mono/diheme cytochrome c family protein